MSETKKKMYKRVAAAKAARELIPRIEAINNDNADYHYYNKIKDVILFGSFVNTDQDMVHDLDVCVVHDDDRDLLDKFYRQHRGTFKNLLQDLFCELYLKQRFTKNGKSIYSLHSNVEEGSEIISIATSKEHVYLFRDHKLCDDALGAIDKLAKA